MDKSPDALLVVNRDGVIVQANARAGEMFGYETEDLVGGPLLRLIPEPYQDDHPEQRRRFFEKPSARPMGAGLDLEAKRADGSTFPVDISLSPITVGGDIEVVAAVRDITHQRSLQRKYRSLLDTAPDAVVVVSVATRTVVEVNEMAAELFETDERSLVGTDVLDLHPAGERSRYRALFEAHLSPDGVERLDEFEGGPVLVETETGDCVPVEISSSVTAVGGRELVTCILRDISKRRAHERELERQLARVERLTHVLAHDIRNPLAVAKGRLDLVADSADTDHVDAIATAHDRIDAIVNDALTLIRDGFEVEYVEPIRLAEIARDCWRVVTTDDATLEVENIGEVEADPRRIRHLFENLFRNSVEHGGPGVTVRLVGTDDGFAVEDDGPGIPEDVEEQIFDAGWTSTADGTGLGLTIVNDVAAAHGWSVRIGEATSGGARFEFTGLTRTPANQCSPMRSD